MPDEQQGHESAAGAQSLTGGMWAPLSNLLHGGKSSTTARATGQTENSSGTTRADSGSRRLPSKEPSHSGEDTIERCETADGTSNSPKEPTESSGHDQSIQQTYIQDTVALIQDAVAHIQDAVAHIQTAVERMDHRTPSEVEKAVRVDTNDSLSAVRTVSRVPGNATYYEKHGLRTMGDGQDHTQEEPMTFRKFMIFVAMGFLWTGSQIPLYLFGGIIPNIEETIGGADRYVWIALGNLIPLATVTPFVGPISDVFGRRNIAMFATLCGIVGSIVCATTYNMNMFIGGQTVIGVGAGIGELTALAVAGESAPTRKRGVYIGGIILTIIPYCPSVLYAQLISVYSSWRFVGLWTALWNFIGLVLIAVFYWPPPRPNAGGLTRWEIAKRLDYVGGLLSASGLTLFLAGLTWAGNQYEWSDDHVRVTVPLGACLIVLFFVWEIWLVPYPMFPARLKQNPRALYVICFITFVSGANFFAVLVFWPTQYYATYTGDTSYPSPTSVGRGSLPVGFCIIGGSIIFSIAVTVLKGKIRLLMVVACVIMTAGNGSMAAANLNNLPGVYAAVTFACLGVGAVIVPNQIIATIICPDDLIATITALTISVRIVGGIIGYAAYYHLLRTGFLKAIFVYLAPVVIGSGVLDPIEFGQIAMNLSGNLRATIPHFPAIDTPDKVAAVIHAGRQCFAAAYSQVYYVSIAFGGAAIIAACFLPDITKLMDNHVAVQYKTEREH
ncbi:MAG: hypothetical protein M1822_003943 [Bathelium mastoideum]|nr:MAG: hypothetical protein M1822_003943 [Bathelium mastoideum]